MKTIHVAVALALAALLEPLDGRADDGQAVFTGLWQGIDGVDGSVRTISISEIEDEGVFEVLASDTYWTLCDGSRGLQQSQGRVGVDGVLHTEGSLACAASESVDVELTYTPQGVGDGQLYEVSVGTPFENVLFRIDKERRPSRTR